MLTPITLLCMLILYFLIKDSDTKAVLLVSASFLLVDNLFVFLDNWGYYFRIASQDIIISIICCQLFLSDNNKRNLLYAAIVCMVSASTMIYEGMHPYQSPIYHYLNTIQFVLMQLYLIALTYKANWRLPCPEQLKSLLLSRNRSKQNPTTAQNECLPLDMERW